MIVQCAGTDKNEIGSCPYDLAWDRIVGEA